MLLVMLGACVFLWGFGYKLSLYDMQRPTVHRVPEAKLLSKNEDTQAAEETGQVQGPDQAQVPTILFQLAAVTIAAAGACASLLKFEQKTARLKPRLCSYTPSLYFRPPPIQSLL